MDNRLKEQDVIDLGWELSNARDNIGQGKVYGYVQRFKHSNKVIFYSLTKQSYRVDDNRFFLTWHIIDTITDFEGEINLLLENKQDLENLMKILDIRQDEL
jgi:hypothetical protein